MKGDEISSTPHYYFHPLHKHLDISRVITAETSPLLAVGLEPGPFGFRAEVANHYVGTILVLTNKNKPTN